MAYIPLSAYETMQFKYKELKRKYEKQKIVIKELTEYMQKINDNTGVMDKEMKDFTAIQIEQYFYRKVNKENEI